MRLYPFDPSIEGEGKALAAEAGWQDQKLVAARILLQRRRYFQG
jgi:hypothetical protein